MTFSHGDGGRSLGYGNRIGGCQRNASRLLLSLQVLDAIGERVECVSYDSWRCYLPEGDFLSRIGPSHFDEVRRTAAQRGGARNLGGQCRA